MPRQVFDYDPPGRFVAGTVGQPGQRTFFLQASGSAGLTSVALEKQQVAALAERVDELLDEVLRRSGGAAPVPAVAPVGSEDLQPLDTPIEEEFRVGTMSLVWDADRQVVVIECFEIGDDPETEDETEDETEGEAGDETDVETVPARDARTGTAAGTDAGTDADLPGGEGDPRSVLRVAINGAAARAFAKRALALVAAGRPPCPFCANPLDPEGHVCPRANGYRR
jgi:uncharacterized repeat protein (TIGR03847 family)